MTLEMQDIGKETKYNVMYKYFRRKYLSNLKNLIYTGIFLRNKYYNLYKFFDW